MWNPAGHNTHDSFNHYGEEQDQFQDVEEDDEECEHFHDANDRYEGAARAHRVFTDAEEEQIHDRLEQQCQGRKRLSGAARRRCKKLREMGMSYSESTRLCVKPNSELTKMLAHSATSIETQTSQSHRSEEKSPTTHHTEKAPVDVQPLPRYKDVAGAIRVGIKDDTPMTEEQMLHIRRLLVQAIVRTTKQQGGGPKFRGFAHKTGWILITCEDQECLDWLVRELPDVNPWSGANLTLIDEKDLPRPMVVTTFYPKSEVDSIQSAHEVLWAQNTGLNPDLWRRLHVREDPNGWKVTYSIDDASHEALQETQFRVNLGFTAVHFKAKGAARRQMDRPKIDVASEATPRPEGTGVAWEATAVAGASADTWAYSENIEDHAKAADEDCRLRRRMERVRVITDESEEGSELLASGIKRSRGGLTRSKCRRDSAGGARHGGQTRWETDDPGYAPYY